jgi:hypothetical protein
MICKIVRIKSGDDTGGVPKQWYGRKLCKHKLSVIVHIGTSFDANAVCRNCLNGLGMVIRSIRIVY